MDDVSSSASPRLQGFGLESEHDEWLERVREAESRPVLGRLGAYELIVEVSRGGQGVVYRARQPGTNRDIALKRLLAGSFATPEARRRFEREIEAAAALGHENVVTIHGVDVVDGEPILAMQWIDGVPINRWARPDGAARGMREILEAFVATCAGVAHAHQHGVIHRDLKPSNILVDASGKPRVLDFGLAKRVVAPDEPSLTTIAGFAGTPQYAAPEQISPGRGTVDVRSDVYALGVVLFELLTGRLPFSDGQGITELLKSIEEQEPPRPSSCAHGIARELDTIVLKALSKEKTLRYGSVDALAEDVQRHLRGEPILAHPPSALYQLRKFARRHWLPLSVACTFFVLIALFAVLQTLNVHRISLARDATDREAAKARDVLHYFKDRFLAAAGPLQLGPDAKLRQALDLAREQVGTSFAAAPEVRAEILTVLGSSYAQMGELRLSEELLREADEIQTRSGGVELAQRVETLSAFAYVLLERGQDARAFELIECGIQLLASTGELRSEFAYLGRLRAEVLLGLGRYSEATREAEKLAEKDRALSVGGREAASNLQILAACSEATGDSLAAVEQIERAVEIERSIGLENDPWLAATLMTLGSARVEVGEFDSALAASKEALAIRTARYGERHYLVAEALIHTIDPLMALDRSEEARDAVDRASEIVRGTFAERDPFAAKVMCALAGVLNNARDFEQADQLSRKSLEVLQETRGSDHPEVITALIVRAQSRRGMGANEEAKALIHRAIEARRALTGADHAQLADALNALGLVLTSTGEFEEAKRALRESGEILRRHFGDQHPRLITLEYNLAHALDAQGERLGDPRYYVEAAQHFRAALDAARKRYPPGHSEQADAFDGYMGDLVYTDRSAEAEGLCTEMLAEWEARLGKQDARVGTLEGWLGVIYRDTKRFEQAERSFLEAIECLSEASGRDSTWAQEFGGALYTTYAMWGGKGAEADRCWATLEPATQARFAPVHEQFEALRARK